MNPSSPAAFTAQDARWFAAELQPHEAALRAWLQVKYPMFNDIDDVVNESYLNLLRRQASGRIVHIKAYLFASARNAARQVFRKRRMFADVPLADLPDSCLIDRETDVVGTVQAQQEELLVAEAIARLPGRCREIVRMRAVQGMSYEQIGAQLGLSEATVRVQVHRAILKCADFVGDRSRSRQPGAADDELDD